ncbi:tRNA uridine(34) 5-carboxymethylaminomethyl modification radical SAM/GNAT enzyme Elp3 [Candidatus Bathyarchaeota archaeon]|nr:tRNA uridine(34) 5-carboxymethylaminomethyl modification radical SAM/GNAT enzyme Elp3 [Candidatus Bathyarchaeota archaeon]
MNRTIALEIIEELKRLPKPTRNEVNQIKTRVAKKHCLNQVPRNSEILKYLEQNEQARIQKILSRKPVRVASGVTVVAVMTKPWSCPHGQSCAYCPGGPAKGVPQSYTGLEPAAMRGSQNGYDAYKQVRHRIEQYQSIGHCSDKVELIIMGGTFLSTPREYQEKFVKGCLDAVNGTFSSSLEEAKRLSETGKIRNVGITIETRPDWAKECHVDQMLYLGVTRVEIGVQNVYDDIYEIINRGHTVKDVIESTRIIKDSGLKIVYHMMPGLPGSNFDRDLEGFKKIFSDSDFKPDMLKIYPCLVIEGTKLYEWWKQGKYVPYSTEEAVRLISEIKKIVPEWIRIMRVQRDIPAYLIKKGVNKSNLRELVIDNLRKHGLRCKCIRCREAGHRWLKDGIVPDYNKVEVLVNSYDASRGIEHFISVEDKTNNVLLGYLRLRFPSNEAHRPEIQERKCSLIRELRVCGPVVPVGKRFDEAHQHKGFGKMLLRKAEEISKEHGYDKIIVTSALGTKAYYKRLGYGYDGPYMSKIL